MGHLQPAVEQTPAPTKALVPAAARVETVTVMETKMSAVAKGGIVAGAIFFAAFVVLTILHIRHKAKHNRIHKVRVAAWAGLVLPLFDPEPARALAISYSSQSASER
jgi:hypothetical protein